MEIKVIGNNTFIQCAHCAGTSICQHGQYRTYELKDELQRIVSTGAYLNCIKCGSGNKIGARVKLKFFGPPHGWSLPDFNELPGPICSICNGKGFIKVE